MLGLVIEREKSEWKMKERAKENEN